MLTNIFKRDLTVTRTTGSFVNRKWVGNTETFTIKASVHALSSQEMELYPEGYRDQMAYNLYTNSELKTSIQGSKTPDVVRIDNYNYQVMRVENWRNTALSHYKVTVFRINGVNQD